MRFFYLFLFLFSIQSVIAQNTMHDICPLKVGAEIPTVSVMDNQNEAQELSTLIGEKPSVLIFYRGAWCGYCTKHLAELNDIKADVETLGYQMFGITIDQSSKLEESNIRSESEIQVYSDASAEAIKAFGLDWQVDDATFDKYKNKYNLDLESWSGQDHHALPVPAIYIVKDGIVQFHYVNPTYSTRLKAETLMAILKTL